MNIKKAFFVFAIFLYFYNIGYSQKKADKPLFRDPVQDGAADPVIVYNRQKATYYMLYTNRRAKTDSLSGVAWVHGTNIGIASSKNGATWNYEGICNFDYKLPGKHLSFWAPDVVYHNGIYHMYVSIVPGVFEDWYHPRNIVHFTSKNLKDWKFESKLKLSSARCIDANIFRLPNGNWRLYYNNENDNKSMYFADSPDLYHWKDSGKKVISTRGEGAKVFQWKETNWMIIDSWNGLTVFHSEDLIHWKKQENRILEKPGTGKDDQVKGSHCDVVVQDGKAYIFYFTHPGRTPKNKGIDNYTTRRSSIQVAELYEANGKITCNRNKDVFIHLQSPRTNP